jgi:hypothetical protein
LNNSYFTQYLAATTSFARAPAARDAIELSVSRDAKAKMK